MAALLATTMGFAQGTAEQATVPHASMHLQLGQRDAVKVPFRYDDAGTPTPISWGMDTAWDDEGNILRGINFIGLDNLTYGRFSFQVMDPLDANGNLSERQIKYLKSRLDHIALTNPAGLLLNSDPVDIDVNTYTHHPEEFYKVIKATVKYAQDYGMNVVSIAPFNEPDVTASNQGTKADFKAVAKLIREDPFFDSMRICAGNTCNDDRAWEWYDYMKPYVDEGNTHQLAGNFDNYANFFTKVKAEGKVATNDELHNVMEGIVGAQYGMENGIWWGTVGPTRGDFCVATSPGGARLGYGENRAAWTGAAIYRLPNGVVKAFAGASERQAFPSSYEYVSVDRPLYYDGHGPYYSYTVSLPGGYRYGDAYQKSAEKSVQIRQGEDVPIYPLSSEQSYIIVNKKSQKLLTIQGGGTGSSELIVQYDNQSYPYQQWTLEPLRDNGGDLTGYYIHSVRTANMNMETGGFQVKVGGTVSVYPVTKAENQRWTFEYAGDGYYKIRNYQSGLYLEVLQGSTSNNAGIRLCASAEEDHQLWKLLPADAACETVAPAIPTGLVAEPRGSSIMLSWDENTQDRDFYGFMVLRGKENAEGNLDYDVIGRGISGTQFIDNTCHEGITYHYAVVSVDYSQNRSAKSETVEAAVTGEEGLVAHYEFDRAPNDLSGNMLHAIVADAAGYTAEHRRAGSTSLLLDGTTNYAKLPALATSMGKYSVAAWVYSLGTMNKDSRLFHFCMDDKRGVSLSMNNSGKMCLMLRNGEWEHDIYAPTLSEGWHHIALTFGAGHVALYVDGEEQATADVAEEQLAAIRPVLNYIGCGYTLDTPLMAGCVDDLRIYNYALSPAEIAQVMSEADVTDSQGWAPPVVPGMDIEKITSSDVVYLYNVGSDAFVTYGMSWNTQCLAQRLPKGDKSTANKFRVGLTKSSNNKVVLSMRDKSNVYIGCLSDANNVWVDRSKSEGALVWQSVASPSGQLYTLKSEVEKDFLDVSYAYGGPLTTRHGRGHIHWAFIAAKDITSGSYAKYKERRQLYAIYKAIVEAGIEPDFATELQEAHAVYAATDATVEALRAATRELILATAPYLTTEVNVSALFTNADMLGSNTTADWTTATTTIKDGDIEVSRRAFVLQQTQTDLPNGLYEVVFHGFYRNDDTGKYPTVAAAAQSTVKANMVTRDDVLEQAVLMTADENTAGAAQMLASEVAQTVLSDIIVDNHQLTLTVTVTSSAQWVNFQGFDIIYKGPFVRVEIPASGYTTFYYGKQSFLLPMGMMAYTLTQRNSGISVSRRITSEGTVLPAGQAVVLQGEPGIYDMIPTTKTKAVDTRNQLQGSDVDELTHGGSHYYALEENAQGRTEWVWKAIEGSTFINPAHKAYLVLKEPKQAAESYSIDEITAVEHTETTPETGIIYNLGGQRVDAPHGPLFIKNGKVHLKK